MSYTPSSNYLTVRRLWDILSSFKTKIATALGGKSDKSSTVSNVAWSSSKLTKTINGTTTDVVSASTLKSAMSLNNVTNDAQVKRSEMGTASGVATLDANGIINTSQLPSYVDDVLEYSAKSQFPATGETGKIYVETSTNLTWRWSGTTYVEISPSLALGETSSTAYRGDRGKTAYDHSQLTSGNPHNVTATDVKAVSYDTNSQNLTDTQKGNARTNIGLGTAAVKDVPSSGNASTTQVVMGNDTRLSNSRTPTSHASSATTYGIGTTSNYGHVKLATGDMNGATHADGVAVSKNHTHSQYLTSHQDISSKLNVDGSNATAAGTSAILQKLDAENASSDIDADTEIITSAVPANGTFYRRKASKLWKYILSKISAGTDLSYDSTTGVMKVDTNGTASGSHAFVEGWNTTASGEYSHAEGLATTASSNNAHAEGMSSTASGKHSHAEGYSSIASGESSHAEGYSRALGRQSHAEGFGGNSDSYGAHGAASHVEGSVTLALGTSAHAEGGATCALGKDSHAEGLSGVNPIKTALTANHSAETSVFRISNSVEVPVGSYVLIPLGVSSQFNSKIKSVQTEGSNLVISTWDNFATALTTGEYIYIVTIGAMGIASHVEGFQTFASGNYSHAEGYITKATAESSHAEGQGTVAETAGMHAAGRYNSTTKDMARVTGWGNSSTPSDIERLDPDGNLWVKGYVHGATPLIVTPGTTTYTEVYNAFFEKRPFLVDMSGFTGLVNTIYANAFVRAVPTNQQMTSWEFHFKVDYAYNWRAAWMAGGQEYNALVKTIYICINESGWYKLSSGTNDWRAFNDTEHGFYSVPVEWADSANTATYASNAVGNLATDLANKSDVGHKHPISDLTMGILAVGNGGTGQSTEQGIVDNVIQAGLGTGDTEFTDNTDIITCISTGYTSTNKRLYRRKASYLWPWIISHYQVNIFKDSADVYVRVGADSNHCIYLDYDAVSGSTPVMGLWARWGSGGSNAKWMAECDSSGNCKFNGNATSANIVSSYIVNGTNNTSNIAFAKIVMDTTKTGYGYIKFRLTVIGTDTGTSHLAIVDLAVKIIPGDSDFYSLAERICRSNNETSNIGICLYWKSGATVYFGVRGGSWNAKVAVEVVECYGTGTMFTYSVGNFNSNVSSMTVAECNSRTSAFASSTDGAGSSSLPVYIDVNGQAKATTASDVFDTLIGVLNDGNHYGSSVVTDGTDLLTSYADNNGFSGHVKPYKRAASTIWRYIRQKLGGSDDSNAGIGIDKIRADSSTNLVEFRNAANNNGGAISVGSLRLVNCVKEKKQDFAVNKTDVTNGATNTMYIYVNKSTNTVLNVSWVDPNGTTRSGQVLVGCAAQFICTDYSNGRFARLF